MTRAQPLRPAGYPGRVVGLTGGVASGKSTVARFFAELGARVVDADALARQVVEPGRIAHRQIVQTFGGEVLGPDGRLDRKALAARIFADPEQRALLNAITHPRIRRAARLAIRASLEAGARLVLYEAALLVENQVHLELDALIVVKVDPAVQIERLMRRDGLDQQTALGRVRSQLPLERKLEVADHVVDTSGTLARTRGQVEKLWQLLAG